MWNRGIRTEQNRADYLFDVNYTVSSQSNTKIIYIPRSQIRLKCLNQVIVLILLSWLNPYMPIKLRFWSAFMGLHLWLLYFLIILTYYFRCILWLYQMLEFLIISNQVSSIMHFNNWRLSPIPSPSPLPPTQKVHVASLLCRYEPRHEISNNVVCATSKGSDQPADTRSLIRALASRLNILWLLSYWPNIIWSSKVDMRMYRLVWVYTCQNATLLEITCHGSYGVDTVLYGSSAGPYILILSKSKNYYTKVTII